MGRFMPKIFCQNADQRHPGVRHANLNRANAAVALALDVDRHGRSWTSPLYPRPGPNALVGVATVSAAIAQVPPAAAGMTGTAAELGLVEPPTVESSTTAVEQTRPLNLRPPSSARADYVWVAAGDRVRTFASPAIDPQSSRGTTSYLDTRRDTNVHPQAAEAVLSVDELLKLDFLQADVLSQSDLARIPSASSVHHFGAGSSTTPPTTDLDSTGVSMPVELQVDDSDLQALLDLYNEGTL